MKLVILINNQYLSPAQCGVQAVHVCSDMYGKYNNDAESYPIELSMYNDWATNHKTAVILKGGNCVTLTDSWKILEQYAYFLHLPIHAFHEDATLNNALTGVGIILPEAHDLSIWSRPTFNELRAYLDTFKLLDFLDYKND